MSEGLIPKETRALVGSSWGDPTKGEVLRKESVRFAQSVNDLNPLYFDEEYAKEAGYEGTITPPMFFHIALTPSLPLSETQPDGLFRTGRRELKLNGADRSMFGGEEVEFLAPVHPGDVLEGATEWESIEEKQGASGAFVVTVWKTTIKNQHGEIVAISHGSGIAMTDLRPSTHWEDVTEGEELPVVSNSANQTQLLTFSAITWNPHRIHYERDYALSEGHADVIVHGPLQGAWLSQYVTDWIGPLGRMKRLKWQNRGSALVGETVTFRGWVRRKYEQDGEHLVDVEVVEENSEGRVIMPGEFTASLPTRSG